MTDIPKEKGNSRHEDYIEEGAMKHVKGGVRSES